MQMAGHGCPVVVGASLIAGLWFTGGFGPIQRGGVRTRGLPASLVVDPRAHLVGCACAAARSSNVRWTGLGFVWAGAAPVSKWRAHQDQLVSGFHRGSTLSVDAGELQWLYRGAQPPTQLAWKWWYFDQKAP